MMHVYPVGDLFEHDLEGTDCWCEPEVRWTDTPEGSGILPESIVIHWAADGRMLREP